jgi:hypothetical protein
MTHTKNEKAPLGFCPTGFATSALPPDVSNLIENVGNKVRQIETDATSCGIETQSPLPISRRGL